MDCIPKKSFDFPLIQTGPKGERRMEEEGRRGSDSSQWLHELQTPKDEWASYPPEDI
jgi:hypothetical protein